MPDFGNSPIGGLATRPIGACLAPGWSRQLPPTSPAFFAGIAPRRFRRSIRTAAVDQQRVRSHKTKVSAPPQPMRHTTPAFYHTMIQNLRPTRNSCPLVLALLFLSLFALAGCARNPTVGSISEPPIPEREARIWFYRLYIP